MIKYKIINKKGLSIFEPINLPGKTNKQVKHLLTILGYKL